MSNLYIGRHREQSLKKSGKAFSHKAETRVKAKDVQIKVRSNHACFSKAKWDHKGSGVKSLLIQRNREKNVSQILKQPKGLGIYDKNYCIYHNNMWIKFDIFVNFLCKIYCTCICQHILNSIL